MVIVELKTCFGLASRGRLILGAAWVDSCNAIESFGCSGMALFCKLSYLEAMVWSSHVCVVMV